MTKLLKQKLRRRREEGALEEPFPSAPSRLAKHTITAHSARTGQSITVGFCGTYAAAAWIEALEERVPGKWRWYGSDSVSRGNGLVNVEGETLQEVFEHVMTEREKAWVLPEPYPEALDRFCGIRGMSGARARQVIVDDVHDEPGAANIRQKSAGRAQGTPGLVDIATIAGRLGMNARDARAALRSLQVVKPSGGWVWDARGSEVIENTLRQWKDDPRLRGRK